MVETLLKIFICSIFKNKFYNIFKHFLLKFEINKQNYNNKIIKKY